VTKQAKVHQIVTEVLAVRPDAIGTHWDECWKYHIDCLATVIRKVLDD
jgi:hypothetical protein